MDKRDIVMLAEQGHHLLALALPHQSVVNIHTGQLVTDGFMDQHGRNRGIHPARQATDHPALADLLTDLLDGFGPVGCHCPVALQARDAMREIAQQFTPMHRVHDFRMELRAVEFAFGV